VTLEDLAARVARLEEHQGLATRADLVEVRVELSRDIANLATGIGTDLREIRAQLTTQGQDLAGIHAELAEIRHLLERRAFRWPWERA